MLTLNKLTWLRGLLGAIRDGRPDEWLSYPDPKDPALWDGGEFRGEQLARAAGGTLFGDRPHRIRSSE